MAKSLIRDYTLKGIANAIREKKGIVGEWSNQDESIKYTFSSDGTGSRIVNNEEMDFTYEYDNTSGTIAISIVTHLDLIKNGKIQGICNGLTYNKIAGTSSGQMVITEKTDGSGDYLSIYTGTWDASVVYSNDSYDVTPYQYITMDYNPQNQSQGYNNDQIRLMSDNVDPGIYPEAQFGIFDSAPMYVSSRTTETVALPSQIPQSMDRLYICFTNVVPEIKIYNLYLSGIGNITLQISIDDGVLTITDENDNSIELEKLETYLPSEMDDEIALFPPDDTLEEAIKYNPNIAGFNTYIAANPFVLKVRPNSGKSLMTLINQYAYVNHLKIIGTIENAQVTANGFIEKLDLSDLYVNGNFMLSQCPYSNAMTSIKFPKKISGNVTRYTGNVPVFYGGYKLKTIENLDEILSKWYTNEYYKFFEYMNSLEDITLDFSKVTYESIKLTMFFSNCKASSITFIGNNIKVSSFNGLFYGCGNQDFEKVYGLDTFDYSLHPDMGAMFLQCSLTDTIINNMFNGVIQGSNTNNMFRSVSGLQNITLSLPYASNIVEMFDGCKLQTLTLTLNNSYEFSFQWFFRYCSKLTSFTITNSYIVFTNLYEMFRDCTSITSIDLSNFHMADTMENAYWINGAFRGCTSLELLNISSIDLTTISNTSYIVDAFTNIKSGCTVVVMDNANKTLLDGLVNNITVIPIEEFTG